MVGTQGGCAPGEPEPPSAASTAARAASTRLNLLIKLHFSVGEQGFAVY